MSWDTVEYFLDPSAEPAVAGAHPEPFAPDLGYHSGPQSFVPENEKEAGNEGDEGDDFMEIAEPKANQDVKMEYNDDSQGRGDNSTEQQIRKKDARLKSSLGKYWREESNKSDGESKAGPQEKIEADKESAIEGDKLEEDGSKRPFRKRKVSDRYFSDDFIEPEPRSSSKRRRTSETRRRSSGSLPPPSPDLAAVPPSSEIIDEETPTPPRSSARFKHTDLGSSASLAAPDRIRLLEEDLGAASRRILNLLDRADRMYDLIEKQQHRIEELEAWKDTFEGHSSSSASDPFPAISPSPMRSQARHGPGPASASRDREKSNEREKEIQDKSRRDRDRESSLSGGSSGALPTTKMETRARTAATRSEIETRPEPHASQPSPSPAQIGRPRQKRTANEADYVPPSVKSRQRAQQEQARQERRLQREAKERAKEEEIAEQPDTSKSTSPPSDWNGKTIPQPQQEDSASEDLASSTSLPTPPKISDFLEKPQEPSPKPPKESDLKADPPAAEDPSGKTVLA